MIRPADSKVSVTIMGWHENYPPGIVECSLLDRFGKDWRMTFKQYDMTETDLYPESEYPLPGSVACIVISQGKDGNGRETAEVEVDVPLTNLTEAGVGQFDIFADQLV